MNQDSLTKFDSWKEIKKIGLRDILKNKSIWTKIEQILDKEIRALERESNEKLWNEMVNFHSDFRHCSELIELFESKQLETIYTQYFHTSSNNYDGNHALITIQYAEKSKYTGKFEIQAIRLHCLGLKENRHGMGYLRKGGNYSFEHDVVSSLNYLLFGESEGFKQRSL